MHMIPYNARVRKGYKVNKRARFYRKRTVWPFIWEYATRLKALEDLNLKINITKCMQAIVTSLTIKKSVSIRG